MKLLESWCKGKKTFLNFDRSDGNNTILHQAGKESEIDRQQFEREKSEYWKSRFNAFTKEELGAIYR